MCLWIVLSRTGNIGEWIIKTGILPDLTILHSTIQKMIDDVHKMNAKIIISVWPSFDPNTSIFKDLDQRGYIYHNITPDFPKEGRVYNAFNPKARNIVWEHMNKNLFAKGIDGWWLDATEPFEKYDFSTFSDASLIKNCNH